MLVELSIENLGIIEAARLTFDEGFTVFTGETGAGKTMLVEAINLVCGQRAESTVIRDGAEEAHVEARFMRLTETGEEELILARTIHREGRSRAYINGRMATVSALAELGQELVDIHGQHGHQRLLSTGTQRDSLDAYARIDVTPLRRARDEVVNIDAMLAALGGDEKSRAREIDLLTYQCEEIESSHIESATEDEDLSRQEDLLADVVRHREALWQATEHLLGEGGATETTGHASRDIASIASMDELGARLRGVLADLEDIGLTIRAQAEKIEEDPERLEFIRRRRQALRDLQRKYGDSLGDVMSFGIEARGRLDELLSYSERVVDLQHKRDEALKLLRHEQKLVGEARRIAAPKLAKAIEKRLKELAMPHAAVQVSVGDATTDLAGDSVVILLAANPGSAPAPLSKVASGGELARVMLSLRLVLTSEPATMVFDEVDAGIGGAAAIAVASSLRELGGAHQVLAVTHLAQVAASAHHQVVVSKKVERGKTYGSAEILQRDDRVAEIARMLSGGVADESALAHASDLLLKLGASTPEKVAKKPRGS
jgi:DNA repair protein RecN (Recombination protein N)